MSQVNIDAEQQSKNLGRQLYFDHVASQFSYLRGNVLTIIDAAFSDQEQRKAVKDLIRGHFSRQLADIKGVCFDGSDQGNAFAPPSAQ